MARKILNRPNGELHYLDEGQGLPLLLLHGFGEDHRIWNEQRALSRRFRLIAPDLPGSGHSPLQPDSSMEGLAGCVLDLLDAEGIDRCVVLGHSMGGYVALAFAEKYPDRLRALGLVHSTAYADTEEKKETRRKAIGFIRSNGAAAFLKTSIPGLYAEKSRQERPDLIEKHLLEATGFGPDTLIAYYEAMIARPDRRELLRNVQFPVLFLLGRHDNAVPLADGLAQCHLPSDSTVFLLEDAGHMGMREYPQLVMQRLEAFAGHINQPPATE